MSPKLRYLLAGLAIAAIANVGYRVWAGWGLITINATDQPIAQVVRSLEKQGGIRIHSNVPAETNVTMRVKKVPLMHALEVLETNTGANWSVAYFTGPDRATIDSALAAYVSGKDAEGWKRFSLPRMRGFGEWDMGTTDPRTEEWQTKLAAESKLHAYLQQGANVLSASFWAPEAWNPEVAKAPKAGSAREVVPRLARAAGGKSVEVFLLRARREGGPEMAGGPPAMGNWRGGRDREPPSAEMQAAMLEREQAQLARLPADQRSAAEAEMEERRRFREEMAKLTPDQRRAKIEERMEERMNNPERAARFEDNMSKRGAMQTAEKRSEFYKRMLEGKRKAE